MTHRIYSQAQRTPYSKTGYFVEKADPEVVHAGVSMFIAMTTTRSTAIGYERVWRRPEDTNDATDGRQKRSAAFRICDCATTGAGRSVAASWQAKSTMEGRAGACRCWGSLSG